MYDDDSENDSDYVPENDKDADDDSSSGKAKGKSVKDAILSNHRKRKIDAVWEELQAEERTYIEERRKMDINLHFDQGIPLEIPVRKRRKYQIAAFLREVFGDKSSIKIPTSQRPLISPKMDALTFEEAEALKIAAANSVAKLQRKQIVLETRKFAGQEITIETTVMKANAATTSSATSSAAPDAQKLDRLIDSLKGPKAISTVTKSSVDWDSYKTKEGIDEDELVAAKDGYIAKSAFLNACDVASFETEKALRQSQAMKRGK